MLDIDKNPFPSTSIAMTEDGQNMPKSLQSSARKSFPIARPPAPCYSNSAHNSFLPLVSFTFSPLPPKRKNKKKKTTWGKIKITTQK
jgi:hypothetical protein